MKTILIGGYYGAGNLGDEAILAAILGSLTKQRQDLQFIVASFNPQTTRQTFQVESVHWREITELARCVERSDLVIVGGGGLFQDYWGVDRQTYMRRLHGGITTYGTLVKLAKLFGKPSMLYAVGVGPLNSPEARQETRMIFETCTLATVRDHGSLELVQETGLEIQSPAIPVLADPVFCFEPTDGDSAKSAELLRSYHLDDHAPLIGVSLRYWEHGIPFEEWTPILAGQLDEFVGQTGARLLFTPFQIDPEGKFTNDEVVNRLVVSQMQRKERAVLLNEVLPPGVVQNLYGKCDLVIGMRLHAIILGLNAGAPVAAIAYDPKLSSLMEEIGLGEYGLPIASLRDLPKALEPLWERRVPLKSRIAEIIPGCKRRAEQNSQIALSLLDQALPEDRSGPVQFAFERLEQLEVMDEQLKEQLDEVRALQGKVLTLGAENQMLTGRITAMESSRGWKLLESFRKIRRRILGIFHRGS